MPSSYIYKYNAFDNFGGNKAQYSVPGLPIAIAETRHHSGLWQLGYDLTVTNQIFALDDWTNRIGKIIFNP